MPSATVSKAFRRFVSPIAVTLILFPLACNAFAQTTVVPSAKSAPKKASQIPTKPSPQRPAEGGIATLEADQQRQVGKIFYADGHVDVRYQNYRIRADHAEYNSETGVVNAKGNVQLDYLTQHVEADDMRYELQTGHAVLHHVRATFALQRRPTPTLLVSPNPLSFESDEAERINENYVSHPKRMADGLRLRTGLRGSFMRRSRPFTCDKSVHLENGNFRIRSIPVLYLPYCHFSSGAPARFRVHDSGCRR